VTWTADRNVIGLLLITHARLGRELLNAAEFILGSIEQGDFLGIEMSQDPDLIRRQVQGAIARLDQGQGVLILTDLFGGTPSNIALPFHEQDKCEVVTGVNLPMVIKAATSRGKGSLSELARAVCQAGQEAISVAGELLNS